MWVKSNLEFCQNKENSNLLLFLSFRNSFFRWRSNNILHQLHKKNFPKSSFFVIFWVSKKYGMKSFSQNWMDFLEFKITVLQKIGFFAARGGFLVRSGKFSWRGKTFSNIFFPVIISRKGFCKFLLLLNETFRKFNFYHFDAFSSTRTILKGNSDFFSALRLIRMIKFFLADTFPWTFWNEWFKIFRVQMDEISWPEQLFDTKISNFTVINAKYDNIQTIINMTREKNQRTWPHCKIILVIFCFTWTMNQKWARDTYTLKIPLK